MRVVRQLVILGDLADKGCGCFPIGQLLSEECMEYRAGCVKRLELVLNIERCRRYRRCSLRAGGRSLYSTECRRLSRR